MIVLGIPVKDDTVAKNWAKNYIMTVLLIAGPKCTLVVSHK